MTSRYMNEVKTPIPGFQLRARYQSLISKHPVNSGRILTDPNGRPSSYILSSYYLGTGHPAFSKAGLDSDYRKVYPGRYSPARGYKP